MSEVSLFLIRIAYLAVLWIFVLTAISVIRSDMFGARAPAQAPARAPDREPAGRSGGRTAARSQRRRRGTPTQVVVTEGANAGESVSLDALDGASLIIGRGGDAAIQLDDDYVSTRHARIASSGDQWFVEDLGSTNGTYLGSARISQPTEVGAGARIRVGKTVLELKA